MKSVDNLKVKDIMIKEVIFVFPETDIREAAALIKNHRIHGLPVVKEKKVVGIVTRTDFFTRGLSNFHLPSYINFMQGIKETSNVEKEIQKNSKIKKFLNIKIKDIMTEKCFTVNPEMMIKELFEIFSKTEWQSFPVTNKSGTLIGIVTLIDIIKLLKI
ncbi:MAG: CBS domain-containing protein [Patescibacteria group bacterium]|nr:CBS domain-containing protein [Patescibacteria group bacterium]